MSGLADDETLPAPAKEPATDFAPGTQAGGRYRIIRRLGAGAMGEVFEAEDLILHERVALKALRADRTSPAAIERLRREIALARRVTHHNVCRTHDLGDHAGRMFLTMELVDGETLADRVRRGRIPLDEARAIVDQLVQALAGAHAVGVVHRDFKSSNVIVAGTGTRTRAVVTDFGLARSLEGELASLTSDGDLLGTPAYMAPEQVEGKEATPASDIYALGVVMYELVTGALPFRGETPIATATARLSVEPPRARSLRDDLPAAWDDSIRRCMARRPQDRFASVVEVGRACAAPTRKRRTSLLVGLAVAIAIGVSLFTVAHRDGPEAIASARPRFSPASPAAAKFHDDAMAQIARADWGQARELLLRAAAEAPDDPIAQGRLANVLGTLGFGDRADAARQRAIANSAAISGEPKLWLEAIDAAARGDHVLAIARWKSLLAIAPDEVEYHVGLIEATAHHESADAGARVLDAARRAVDGEVAQLALDLVAVVLAQNREARSDRDAGSMLAKRAAEVAGRLGRGRDRAIALVWLASNATEAGEGAQMYDEAIALASVTGDARTVLLAREGLANLHHVNARFVARESAYADNITLGRTLGDRRRLAEMLRQHSTALTDVGRPADAERALREAVEISLQANDEAHTGWCKAFLGRVLKHQGRVEEALTMLDDAFALGDRRNDAALRTWAAGQWAQVLRLHGDDRMAETVHRLYMQAGGEGDYTGAREGFSVLRLDAAIASTVAALDAAALRLRSAIANEKGPLFRAEAQIDLAEVEIKRGNLDVAERLLADATKILDGSGSLIRASWLAMARANLAAARGNAGAAVEVLDRESERLGKHGLHFQQTKLALRAAQLLAKTDLPAAKARAVKVAAEADRLAMKSIAKDARAI